MESGSLECSQKPRNRPLRQLVDENGPREGPLKRRSEMNPSVEIKDTCSVMVDIKYRGKQVKLTACYCIDPEFEVKQDTKSLNNAVKTLMSLLGVELQDKEC